MWRLALRSLAARPLVTGVAVLIAALAWLLFLTAASAPRMLATSLSRPAQPFDGVLGPRGSKLQLVLASIYHLDQPIGTVPLAEVDRLRAQPAVAAAFPFVLGDNFAGFRLFGVEAAFLQDLLARDARLAAGSAEGGAVLGSTVAARTGLRPGDHFAPAHGLNESEEGEHDHDEHFPLVGILAPTGTPLDRLIFTPLEEMQTLDGHRAEAREEVSGVLFRVRPGATMAAMQLDRTYNRAGGAFTLAWPLARIVADLVESFRWVLTALEILTAGFALIAVLTLLALLLQSIELQRPTLLQLRLYGAAPAALGRFIIVQGGALLGTGVLAGSLLYLAVGIAGAHWLRVHQGMTLAWLPDAAAVLPALGAILLVGLLSLAIPVWRSYRLDLAEQLASTDPG